MSDKKPTSPPNKVVEPSPLEKWWAEVQEWRAGRNKTMVARRLHKAERFNDTRHQRGRRRNSASKLVAIDLFGVVGAVFSLVFGLFGALLRMGFWIAVAAGVIWMFLNMEEFAKNAEVEEATEKAAEISSKTKTEIQGLIDGLGDSIEKIKKDWHIEIRTKGEDGEEKVIEFGTKKDEPPEAPANE